ncbi:PI-PLC X domain-containing protein 1-like isoform X2 [Periplaneta americana]
MADMQTALSPLMLRQIFLVGSHDSGSYEEYNPSTSENLVTKYTITQEDDILSQLIYGVRYLDIRAAYYPSTNETWWVNHGVMKIHPMKLILDDVKTFLENTNEIVILDFHEFPAGFGSGLDIHTKLVEYLKEEIGEFAASPSLTWNARTGDIWSSGKRLIVSYNNNDAVAQSDMLWPAVSQQWGNVQTLEDLYSYLSQVMASPPGSKAWSAMVELTPTTMQVITDELGGLRRMAAMVNQNVTAWYRGTWGKTVNIVSADFFRDTGLVEAAISWNHFRSQQLACK